MDSAQPADGLGWVGATGQEDFAMRQSATERLGQALDNPIRRGVQRYNVAVDQVADSRPGETGIGSRLASD